MLYHPDKHRDPELKRQAEQLFNQVHQAYEGKQDFNHLVRHVLLLFNFGGGLQLKLSNVSSGMKTKHNI